MTAHTQRRAARILLVDAAERVLMFRGSDPVRPEHRYWFTPGGGLEADESPVLGAVRELAEETGLVLDPTELGDPVWRDVTEFSFDGVCYRQEQDFFLARVSAWTVNTDGFNAVEQASIHGHRWWSRDELAATDELYYPPELPVVLERVLGEEVPC